MKTQLHTMTVNKLMEKLLPLDGHVRVLIEDSSGQKFYIEEVIGSHHGQEGPIITLKVSGFIVPWGN